MKISVSMWQGGGRWWRWERHCWIERESRPASLEPGGVSSGGRTHVEVNREEEDKMGKKIRCGRTRMRGERHPGAGVRVEIPAPMHAEGSNAQKRNHPQQVEYEQN